MGRPSLDPQWDTNDSPHLFVPRDHVRSGRCIELRRGPRSWVAPIIEHRNHHQGPSRGGLVRERLPSRPVPPTQVALAPGKRDHFEPCAAPARVPGWGAKRRLGGAPFDFRRRRGDDIAPVRFRRHDAVGNRPPRRGHRSEDPSRTPPIWSGFVLRPRHLLPAAYLSPCGLIPNRGAGKCVGRLMNRTSRLALTSVSGGDSQASTATTEAPPTRDLRTCRAWYRLLISSMICLPSA
jgi:hypothetical protein